MTADCKRAQRSAASGLSRHTRQFSAKATQFFSDLEDDNSREFWRANAEVFEREVKQPMTELLESARR